MINFDIQRKFLYNGNGLFCQLAAFKILENQFLNKNALKNKKSSKKFLHFSITSDIVWLSNDLIIKVFGW